MSNGSPTCSVWDASKQDWSSDGCEVMNVTANSVKCACNQLGIFGSLVVSSVCPSNNTLHPLAYNIIV